MKRPLRLMLVLLVAAIVTGYGCSEPGRSADPWEQNWQLDHVEGPEGIVSDRITPVPVSVRFEPFFGGSDGCGQFLGTYEYDDPVLRFPTVEYTVADPTPAAVKCPEEPFLVVQAMRDALRDGVVVTVLTADIMVWKSDSGDTIFEFHAGLEG